MTRVKPLFEVYRSIYDDCIATDRAVLDDFGRHGVLADVRSVYSVGPGFGPLELQLMRQGIDVGYAEPYVPFAEELEQRAAAAGLSDRIVERHWVPFHEAAIARRYDLVLAAQSWYPYADRRAPLDRALGVCASGGRMVIVTQALDSPMAEVFGMQRSPALDVHHVSAWLTDGGLAHEVRLVRTTVAQRTLLDDDDRLTDRAVGLAAFLSSRTIDQLEPRSLERVRASLVARPEGVDHVRGIILIPASQ